MIICIFMIRDFDLVQSASVELHCHIELTKKKKSGLTLWFQSTFFNFSCHTICSAVKSDSVVSVCRRLFVPFSKVHFSQNYWSRIHNVKGMEIFLPALASTELKEKDFVNKNTLCYPLWSVVASIRDMSLDIKARRMALAFAKRQDVWGCKWITF